MAVSPYDRCSAPACAFGTQAALAGALRDHCAEQTPNIAARRQQRAYDALESALAEVLTPARRLITRQQYARKLTRLCAEAEASTRQGVPAEDLVQFAGPLPSDPFRIDLPSLCWAAVARLREALEQIAAASPPPRRIAQLQCVGALELALRQTIKALHAHAATLDAASIATAGLFDKAETAIGDELGAIFAEAAALPALPERLQ